MENRTAKPRGISYIRNIASAVRKLLNLSNDTYINTVQALDCLCSILEKFGFNYLVLPDCSEFFEKGEEAKTNIVSGMIYIKESVFLDASRKRYCRAHFTIAHEIDHFILHHALGLMNLARTNSSEKPKPFENPEWQADAFASELLMPYEECLKLSPKEIMRKYHVTNSAATTRYNKIHQSEPIEKAKAPASASAKTLRRNLRTHEDYMSKVSGKGGV